MVSTRCQVAAPAIGAGGLAVTPGAPGAAHERVEQHLRAGGGREHVALVEQRGIGHRPAVVQVPDQILARDLHVLE
jgi:hypothetical protein